MTLNATQLFSQLAAVNFTPIVYEMGSLALPMECKMIAAAAVVAKPTSDAILAQQMLLAPALASAFHSPIHPQHLLSARTPEEHFREITVPIFRFKANSFFSRDLALIASGDSPLTAPEALGLTKVPMPDLVRCGILPYEPTASLLSKLESMDGVDPKAAKTAMEMGLEISTSIAPPIFLPFTEPEFRLAYLEQRDPGNVFGLLRHPADLADFLAKSRFGGAFLMVELPSGDVDFRMGLHGTDQMFSLANPNNPQLHLPEKIIAAGQFLPQRQKSLRAVGSIPINLDGSCAAFPTDEFSVCVSRHALMRPREHFQIAERSGLARAREYVRQIFDR